MSIVVCASRSGPIRYNRGVSLPGGDYRQALPAGCDRAFDHTLQTVTKILSWTAPACHYSC
jgi:hypothetical protein